MTESKVLKEALSIPNLVENFCNVDDNPYKEILNLINQKKIKYIVTVARGTSDCAALYSSYIFAKYLGLPSYSMPPSILTLEKSKFDFSEALVIVISQSGKSTDLIECEKKSQEMGATTILISNNENSPIVNSAPTAPEFLINNVLQSFNVNDPIAVALVNIVEKVSPLSNT